MPGAGVHNWNIERPFEEAHEILREYEVAEAADTVRVLCPGRSIHQGGDFKGLIDHHGTSWS